MAGVQRKVCLITTSHIASDPRLVKEAITLSQNGFLVHIIFAQYVVYLVDHDQKILNDHPEWTYFVFNCSGNTYSSKVKKTVTGVFQKILRLRFNAEDYAPLAALLLNRGYKSQLKSAIRYKADLYIAHNLGAVAIACKAAERNNAKCSFDAEDFHRNEISNNPEDYDVKVKTIIEDTYLPQVDYLTAASPLIAAQYSLLYKREVTPIVNVFPKTNIHTGKNYDRALQLFWFSQTIGPDRGLETVIEAISQTKQVFELHLLGYVQPEYKASLTNFAISKGIDHETVHWHQSVYPDALFNITSTFDIGLATETGYPFNRDICLTNKIFTYIQSGLAVAATKTKAQTEFIDQYPQVGKLYGNADELASILLSYHHNRNELIETKTACFELGQTTLNWENEQSKFLEVVRKVLNE